MGMRGCLAWSHALLFHPDHLARRHFRGRRQVHLGHDQHRPDRLPFCGRPALEARRPSLTWKRSPIQSPLPSGQEYLFNECENMSRETVRGIRGNLGTEGERILTMPNICNGQTDCGVVIIMSLNQFAQGLIVQRFWRDLTVL